MAGRLQWHVFVVPPQEVMALAAIAAEIWRLGSLFLEINTKEACL